MYCNLRRRRRRGGEGKATRLLCGTRPYGRLNDNRQVRETLREGPVLQERAGRRKAEGGDAKDWCMCCYDLLLPSTSHCLAHMKCELAMPKCRLVLVLSSCNTPLVGHASLQSDITCGRSGWSSVSCPSSRPLARQGSATSHAPRHYVDNSQALRTSQ